MRAIIYTQRVEIVESYHERRDCADQRIADFIRACGYLPIPIPNQPELAEEILRQIRPSGIILTGGNSLMDYGGNAPERDAMDRALIQLSIQNTIPLYGFCRGMQSILDFFGNELVNVNGHVAVRHVIQDAREGYEVNSYHNQACVQLKVDCGLTVTARTEDGVIEAVRHDTLPIIGTMWHPEREKVFSSRDIEKIKKFFRSDN